MKHIINNIFIGGTESLCNNRDAETMDLVISLVGHGYTFKNNVQYFFNDDQHADMISIAKTIYKKHLKTKKGPERILLHCMAGRSRCVSVIMYYIMKYYKLNFDKCKEYMSNIDEVYDIHKYNPHFANQLLINSINI